MTFSMKKTMRTISIAALLLATFSCRAENEFGPLIVNGAYDVQKTESQDAKRKQLTYEVNVDYPEVAITDVQYAEFKKSGWVKCGGDANEWTGYLDASGSNPRYVHQNIQHWHKGNSLMTVTMRYYSKVDKGQVTMGRPGNSIQHVILVYDDYSNLSEVATRLGLSCD